MIEPNEPLLREVQKLILEEPKRIHMQYLITPIEEIPEDRRPNCGTVGCIYGWAYAVQYGQERAKALLSPGADRPPDFEDHLSQTVLGRRFDEMSADDSEAESSLIFAWAWPLPFRSVIRNLEPGTPEYAQVVSDRIDSFISSHGQDWKQG